MQRRSEITPIITSELLKWLIKSKFIPKGDVELLVTSVQLNFVSSADWVAKIGDSPLSSPQLLVIKNKNMTINFFIS